MLRTAPKFYEIAKRVVEITEDCIIVAHNAEFDYRILRTEFHRLGFDFKRKSLCTVELAKQMIPEQESYSLGKLTRALGIPVSDRHRAAGDAMATVKLFKMILAKDVNKTIIQEAVKDENALKIEPNHKNIIEDLPSITGVYYMHNAEGTVIYISKSKNIRKSVTQHFTSKRNKFKKLQNQVCAVTYEATGSELFAHLKENQEINKIQPFFNRYSKREKFTHALYSFIDSNGYTNLRIAAYDGRKQPITTFVNKQSAKGFLANSIKKYQLCQKLAGLYDTKGSCFGYDENECHGACIRKEQPEDYNKRVIELIEKNSLDSKNVVIIDRGRDVDEHSVFLIEDGNFKGLGFFNLNYQINNLKVLENVITPMEHSLEIKNIIQAYLRKNKNVKMVQIDTSVKKS